jgi:SAM-dependent methyltransferase
MADPRIIAQAVEIIAHNPALPKPVTVLEAGCGSTSDVSLPFENKIVGIDVDIEQLNHNERIQTRIHGDLQTYDLPPNNFDLVACVDVLEHLPRADKAFANISRSVKPGGYLLIAGPEPYSYKGLVAKYTPHSMRYFIHHLITGKSIAETRRIHGNGEVFFPTYMRPICSLKNLVDAGTSSGLKVVFEKAFDAHSAGLAPVYKPFLGIVNIFTKFVKAVTGGRIDLLLADYVVLLQKAEQ